VAVLTNKPDFHSSYATSLFVPASIHHRWNVLVVLLHFCGPRAFRLYFVRFQCHWFPTLSSFCKINDGANTLLVNRKGLEIKEVLMIEKGTGKSKTIVPIKTDFLGKYDNADLDPEIYKDALLEPPGWNGGRDEGVRERRLNNMIKSQVSEMEHSRRLDLTGCQSVKVIYITIGADLPFRDYYGSVENAAARIASIFEMANMYYEKFCKRLKVRCMVKSCKLTSQVPISLYSRCFLLMHVNGRWMSLTFETTLR
jgi:hypothetical protein